MNNELLELSETLRGIAEGKEWEIQYRNGWGSNDSIVIEDALAHRYKIRLKPWKLPDPPDGQQWHRDTGWTQEMLPNGYRPLLLGEDDPTAEQPEEDGRVSAAIGSWGRAQPNFKHLRTRRPLPQPNPTPVLVPLGPEDVPPGSVIRLPLNEGRWYFVLSVGTGGIAVSTDSLKSFKSMMDEGWQIKRPGEGWKPCSREAQS